METALRSNEQRAPSLKRFIWGNIFALCALVVAYIVVTLFFVASIIDPSVIGSFIGAVVIISGPIVVGQSYCLALVRLRGAQIRRAFAEVFIFQLVAIFVMTILSAILATIWPDTFSFDLSIVFNQGYPWIDDVIGILPAITFTYLLITAVFSGVVTWCALLVVPWRDVRVEPISTQRQLLVFGAMLGSATALGILWFAWMPPIFSQFSYGSALSPLLPLLLICVPLLMLMAIGAIATWRSLTQP